MQRIILSLIFNVILSSTLFCQVPNNDFKIDTSNISKVFQMKHSNNTEKYVSLGNRAFIDEYEVSAEDYAIINKLNIAGLSDDEYDLAFKLLHKYKPRTVELIPDIYEEEYQDPRSFFEVLVNREKFQFFGHQPQYVLVIDDLKTGLLVKDRVISASENFRGLNISFKFFKDETLIEEITESRRVGLAKIQGLVKADNVNIILIELTNSFMDKISMKFYLK